MRTPVRGSTSNAPKRCAGRSIAAVAERFCNQSKPITKQSPASTSLRSAEKPMSFALARQCQEETEGEDRPGVAESEAGLTISDTLDTLFNYGQSYLSLDVDVKTSRAGSGLRPASKPEPFSPIMSDGALVLPLVIVGMIDTSITRNPSIPCTRNCSSTTTIVSIPIL